MEKINKTFAVGDEKLLQYAFIEAAEKGESSSYLAKAFKMEDGQEYQISWQIKRMERDVNCTTNEMEGKNGRRR